MSNTIKKQTSFKRVETKFLTSKRNLDTILNYCQAYSKLHYLDPKTQFTLIDSVYFDSDSADFFKHHFSKLERRYKVRVRRYGPDGVWSKTNPLLEIKKKENGVTIKERFYINDEIYKRVLDSKEITLFDVKSLSEINPDLSVEKLKQNIKTLNYLVETYKIHPAVKISYKRLAFEKDNFRVTLDTDVNNQVLSKVSASVNNSIAPEVRDRVESLIDSYSNSDDVIMELKHQEIIPEWCERMLQELNLSKTSFSKYCWGMGMHLNAVNSQANDLMHA